MFFLPRRGYQGRDGNERADRQHQTSLRRTRSKERGAESNPHQPVHAEISHHEGTAWPSPGLLPAPPGLLPTPYPPGESPFPSGSLARGPQFALGWRRGVAVGQRSSYISSLCRPECTLVWDQCRAAAYAAGLAKTLVGCGRSRQWAGDLVATNSLEEGTKEEFGGRL